MTNNPSDLKASGLKATLPRLKILEIFQNSNVRHLSAEDIYKILLTENMDVGLATVYRVLTQFEQAGLLHRNHFETGKAVFDDALATIVAVCQRHGVVPGIHASGSLTPVRREQGWR